MASEPPKLPLILSEQIEPERSWEGLSTPHDLLQYFARNCSVDARALVNLEEFVVSPIEPTGANRSKIWIKNEGAPGIGIPIGSQYKVIYEYPPNVPLLWTGGSSTQLSFPNYLRKLTPAELESFGLTAPTNPDFYYFMLEV